MRVLVTRPAGDAAPLAAILASRGHRVSIDAVIEIAPTETPAPDMVSGMILLFTSANAVRAWAPKSRDREIRVYTVGHHTERAARELGFTDVTSADGDVDALVERLIGSGLPQGTRLLHVRGDVVAGDPAERLTEAGFMVSTHEAYRAVPSPRLAQGTIDALASGGLDGILFFSPRTARHFNELLRRAGLAGMVGGVSAFCLSQAVAESAGAQHFGNLAVARRPTQDALLELLPDAATKGFDP